MPGVEQGQRLDERSSDEIRVQLMELLRCWVLEILKTIQILEAVNRSMWRNSEVDGDAVKLRTMPLETQH